MAQLALGLAGAAIGAPFGMAQLGWTVGSMLGGMFQKGPRIEGPRLSDLKVTNSAYGRGVPIVYGSARIAGNIIWSTDLIETRSEQKQGGKGGPPKAVQVSYTYRVSMAIALCDNEIDGIRRMWFNNELLVNNGSNTATGMIASQVNAASITVYNGTQTQLPDPTIESYVGVGNTPAYRGVAYIVLQDLQLEAFGNRIPNIEVEVVQVGTTQGIRNLGPVAIDMPTDGYAAPPYQVEDNGTPALYYTYGIAAGGLGYTFGANFVAGLEAGAIRVLSSDFKQRPLPNYFFVPGSPDTALELNANNFYTFLIDIESGQVLERAPNESYQQSYFGFWDYTPPNNTGVALVPTGVWYGGADPLYPFKNIYFQTLSYGELIGGGTVAGVYYPGNGFVVNTPFNGTPAFSLTAVLSGMGYNDRFMWGYTMSADRKRVYAMLSEIRNPSNASPSALNTPLELIIELELDDTSYPRKLREITLDPGTDTQSRKDKLICYGLTSAYAGQSTAVENDYKTWWCHTRDNFISTFTVNSSNVLTYTERVSVTGLTGPLPPGINAGGLTLYADGGVCVGVSEQTVFKYSRLPSIQNLQIKLYDIIDDLCRRSDLDVSEWDSSELLQDVDGYVIANPTNARSAMEPLQAVYFFDGVESDYMIKFRNRGRAPVATIIEDDLAAMEGYDTEMPDQLERTRIQELELPRKLTVNYFSKNSDYQENTQHDQRIITRSVNELNVDIPVVLSDDKALQVARANLYAAWEQRETYSFSVNRKYCLLDPTDVVIVNKGSLQFRMRITKRTEGGNGIMRYEGVREDNAQVYTQSGTGAGMQTGQQEVSLPVNTTIKAIDTVSLRPSDINAPLLYIAASGYGSAWQGGVLYKSLDNGSNYIETGDVLQNRAVMGFVDFATPAPDQFGIFDEETVITISLNSDVDTLSSATEAQILAGANACYIGGEIIQFKNATNIGERRWTISGLLRGRLGTEKYAYTHVDGEDFVLLNASSLYTEGFTTTNINQTIYLKAPSFNQTINQAIAKSINYQANNMRPLSPVYIKGIQSTTNGDWSISWIRRSRNGKEWSDQVDAPLAEDKEEYLVEIYDTVFSSKKNQYIATSQSLTYTQAQQIADFGAVQSRFGVKVYQVNGTVGLGDPAQLLVQVGAGRVSDANAAYIDTLILLKPHSLFTFQELGGTTMYNKTRTNAFNGAYFGGPNLNKYENERKSVDFTTGTNDYAGMATPTVDFTTGTSVVHAHKPTSVVNTSEFFTFGGTVGGTVDALKIQRNGTQTRYSVVSHNNTTVSTISENTSNTLTVNDYKIVSFTIAAGTAATLQNAFLYVNNVPLTTTGTQLFVPRNVTRNACYVNRSQAGGLYAEAINCGTAVYRRVLSSVELQQIQNAFDFGAWPTSYKARMSNFTGSDLLGRSIAASAGTTTDSSETHGACVAFDGLPGTGVFYNESVVFDPSTSNFSITFDFKTSSDVTNFQVIFDLGSDVSQVNKTTNCKRNDGAIFYILNGNLYCGSSYASGAPSLPMNGLLPNTWYRVVQKKSTAGIPTGVSNTTSNIVLYPLDTGSAINTGSGTAFNGTGGARHLAIGNFNQTAGLDAPFSGKLKDVRYVVGDFFADAQ